MKPSASLYSGLKHAGIDFVTSVPCVNLGPLMKLVSSDPCILHLPVTREEEGVGVCAGAWMGGKKPALMMQNSGLGNSINALASLDLLYGVPLLMVISHRGTFGEKISAQVPMGMLTEPLLSAMGIPFIKPRPEGAESAVVDAWRAAEVKGTPVAVLLDLDFWRQE
jgi:sulfopyruvate decarboxylase subunit alpha